MYSDSIIERFWSKVEVDSETECWNWKAFRDKNGYGVISINGKIRKAHRISFHIHYRRLPLLNICHSCDNPACCNPHHLWEGTQGDNMKDMADKGRSLHRYGIQHPCAKLTTDKVIEIRQLVSSGVEQKKVAGMFDVTQSAVSKIVTGRTWKHV